MSSLHPWCDSAVAQCAKSPASPPHPNFVLAATILASGLAFVDGSVVNVALPVLARDLNAGADALQWVVNSYLLPLSALLLLGGAAGDRFGRRRLLILGTSLFALASLGCASAPGLPALFASRLLQGVGAAMLMPNSLAILGQSFRGDSKGRAIGIWAASRRRAGRDRPGAWRLAHRLGQLARDFSVESAAGGRRHRPGLAVRPARPAQRRLSARHGRRNLGCRRSGGDDLGSHRRFQRRRFHARHAGRRRDCGLVAVDFLAV